MKKSRPEDLGGKGEGFFFTLCKDAGLIANKSNDDKGGWDYEVEHPQLAIINYSSQSYPVYRVQVKSTSNGQNKFSLTYGNLLKLIQHSGASFIFLATYLHGKMTPDNAFLFHVDESFAKEILREIREKEIKNREFPLNKRVRVITFDECHEIKKLDGGGLKSVFEKNIGPDYLKYVAHKNKFLKKLEIEGKHQEIAITFGEPALDSMVQGLLGYDKKFKINSQRYLAPFGIRDKEPIAIAENTSASFTPIESNLPRVTVCFKTSEFGEQYRFKGVMYGVTMPFPEKYWKIRIKANLFDIIHEPKTDTYRFEFHFSKNIDIEFKEFFDFLCFLKKCRQSKQTFIKIENLTRDKVFEVTMENNSKQLKELFSEKFEILFKRIESIHSQIRDLNLDREIISTRYIFENLEFFRVFDFFTNEHDLTVTFENKNVSIDADVVLFNYFICFKNVIIAFIYGFFGKIEHERDNIYKGRFHKTELLEKYVINSTINLKNFFEDEFKKHAETFLKKGSKVLKININDIR